MTRWEIQTFSVNINENEYFIANDFMGQIIELFNFNKNLIYYKSSAIYLSKTLHYFFQYGNIFSFIMIIFSILNYHFFHIIIN